MKKIYLLTGAAGFVGNNVARLLLSQGATVRAFINTPEKQKTSLHGLDIEVVYGDVRNPTDIEKLFRANEDVEYIFIHAASIVDIGVSRFSQRMYDVNVLGTKNVVAAARANNVKRLVFVSSVHSIPEKPNNGLITEVENFDPRAVHGAYAKTKAEASAIVMDAVKEGLNAVIVHPSGIIGPNDFSKTHTSQLLTDFAAGKIPAGVTGGYDFVDVRDVAQAIVRATEIGEAGSRWLLSGRYISVKDLLETLNTVLNRNKKLKIFPMAAARLGLPFLWAWAKIRGKRPLYTRYSLYTLRSNGNFSHERASQELGHNPRDIVETLTDTAKFLGLI